MSRSSSGGWGSSTAWRWASRRSPPSSGCTPSSSWGWRSRAPRGLWVLPVALAGQCLLMTVYAELAGNFRFANCAYQWSRRLIGPRYGWFNGWVALCAYAVATRRRLPGRTVGPDVARDHGDRRGRDRPSRASILVLDLLARERDRRRRAEGLGALRVGVVGRGDRVGRHRPRAAAIVPRAGLRRAVSTPSGPRR